MEGPGRSEKDGPARCSRHHSNVVHSRRRCHSDASQCRPVGRLRVSDERRLRGSTTVNSSTKGGSRRDTSRAVAHCRAEETGRDRGAHPTEKAQVLVSSSDSFEEAKHSLCFKREPPQPFVEPVVATRRSAASSAACASRPGAALGRPAQAGRSAPPSRPSSDCIGSRQASRTPSPLIARARGRRQEPSRPRTETDDQRRSASERCDLRRCPR